MADFELDECPACGAELNHSDVEDGICPVCEVDLAELKRREYDEDMNYYYGEDSEEDKPE
jgi:Zn-finger nucleic acid-binding protein